MKTQYSFSARQLISASALFCISIILIFIGSVKSELGYTKIAFFFLSAIIPILLPSIEKKFKQFKLSAFLWVLIPYIYGYLMVFFHKEIIMRFVVGVSFPNIPWLNFIEHLVCGLIVFIFFNLLGNGFEDSEKVAVPSS